MGGQDLSSRREVTSPGGLCSTHTLLGASVCPTPAARASVRSPAYTMQGDVCVRARGEAPRPGLFPLSAQRLLCVCARAYVCVCVCVHVCVYIHTHYMHTDMHMHTDTHTYTTLSEVLGLMHTQRGESSVLSAALRVTPQ